MITVRPIKHNKSQLKKYVHFGLDLYALSPYFVPPLVIDDINTLLPSKNPAFDFCEAQSFMAYRDEQPVGRITAIINRTVNERGMTRMVGPMGFTDMDHEGMLTWGFEEMGTMATIYNFPYYPRHMERLGFGKEVDYVEYRIDVPDSIPDKMVRVSNIVEQRFGLHVKTFTSKKDLKEQYGEAIFELINEAYDKIYGYSPLTPRQVKYYIDMYLGILRLEGVCLIVDADEKLVGVGISMPSMSEALRKAHGKLFPLGWWHLLKGLKGKTEVVDLLLVAVKPEYQSKGVNALLFNHLIPNFIKAGYKVAESNVELEENENVQKQWEYFTRRLHRRRRIWSKDIR